MPPAILAAIGSITVTQVVFAVASLVISSAMASRARKNAEDAARSQADAQRNAYNSGLTDRTNVIRSAIAPRNIVLGRDEASGPLACWFTYGPLRNFHAFAVVLAGHECDAIETVMFNHEPVTLDGNGAVITEKYMRPYSNSFTVNGTNMGPGAGVAVLPQVPTRIDSVTYFTYTHDGSEGGGSSGYYANAPYVLNGAVLTFSAPSDVSNVVINYTVSGNSALFYVRKYLGSPGQAAAPELVAAAAAAGVPAAWDSSRKGTSVCYLTVVVEADFNVLGQIGIPNVSAIVRGVKAYDPRVGGAPAWTENPAILARWFNVDSGYAPKTLDSEVHEAELIASANVCDEYVNFSASRYERRYICNGQLTTAASPMDNFNHILDAMDGDAVWISGQWQIIAGYYKEPTLAIDEYMLSSAGITVVPRTAKRDLFNAISGTFVSPADGYVRTGYAMVTSPVYQAEDGDELLPADASFELVNDGIRCQMIAWQRLTRARQPLTISLGTTLKGYDTAPLQNVTVSLARLGYVSKVFANLRREHEGHTLLHVLQETGPEVWAWDYSHASAAVDIPNTSFPDAVTIPVPEDVEIDSGTAALQVLSDGTVLSRGRIRWTQTTNSFVLSGGKVEWQIKSAGTLTTDWTVLPPAAGEDVEIFTGPLEDLDIMLVRGRFVTGQGRKGAWSPAITFTVLGKTEPPPDVISFAVDGDGTASWSDVVALDLAGYQLRWQPGNNRSWGNASPLHSGFITDNPYLIQIRPSGVATYMIKAVDTSGNESTTAAVAVVNLGDPAIANIVLSYDYKAAGWPGSCTGATVSGGNLVAVADATPLAWDADEETAGWTLDTDAGWTLLTYGPLVYLTDVFVVAVADAGAQLTLPATIAGTAYLIEYRRDGDARGWTADAEPGWTADTDLAWTAEEWR
ncbi:MAG: phage tail fiber protein, partial [Polaromonas sp.]|nr:phage tail fiber protein [Polaromonas sp.]